eukprot:TRINITY_DN46793_c0_g1_i1.p2 TRINITY_DN46793_c0_g1~~TRINITY_DN46793_c0_g1_i1.p2  ORF type:complete len:157 (-),score=51.26 TRINITY_DN46793_c0_g1_i1:207-677(-)
MGKIRPSPSTSATAVPVGTKMKGGDGNMWQVKLAGNGVPRWAKAGGAAPVVKAAAMKAAAKKATATKAATMKAAAAMKAAKGGKLAGKSLCFTGALSIKRSTATAAAKAAGANVTGSVSSKTDILVVGQDAGSKVTKGGPNIEYWPEKKFLRAVGL